MALKVPGCTERIAELWAAVHAGNPRLSQRQFALDNKLDPTKFNNWTKGTQPDYEGLEQLQRVFGVPWQWILVGDDGADALAAYSRKRTKPPDKQALGRR